MKNFFTGNKIKVFLHLLAWVILLGLPLYFFKRYEVGTDLKWVYYGGNVINGIIFYTNYLVLIPKYFFQSSRLRYSLLVLFLLITMYFVSDFSGRLIFKYVTGKNRPEMVDRRRGPADDGTILPDNGRIRRPPLKPSYQLGPLPFRSMHLFNYGFTSLFLVFLSIGMRVLERHSQTEKLQKELEKEKLNSELAFLKNQISPHFFFNTLNNIYSLISINAEDSQKAVLKLSKLMRYMLYDSEHGDTRLSNEIDFMNNYIDLMKLRMNNKILLNISFPENFMDINIPPLIFIPFIENSFKHGISYRQKSFINISMSLLNDIITFRCVNSMVKVTEENDTNHSGIGLENVKKRLNLLFPGSHELVINRKEAEFEVILIIKVLK